jgi:acyl carrier protein
LTKEEKITGFIVENLAPGSDVKIEPDTNLVEEGVVDSTAFMELVLWFEEAFGVAVDVEDMTPENFGTVRNMAEYVERQQAKASS